MNVFLRKIVAILILFWLFFSCKQPIDPFLINRQNIGFLTDSTQIKELKSIYVNDSIQKFIGGDEFTGTINEIEIYDKTDRLLLLLTPTQALDSTATIKLVRIISKDYKTTAGISVTSTFKDIKKYYKISSIQNTLKTIIVSVNDENLYFTIDKKELPPELRYNMDFNIETLHIPDKAPISGLYVHWF